MRYEDILVCPKTGGELRHESDAMVGPQGTRYPRADGLIDFCPDIPPSSGIAQRTMELPAIGRIYEDRFRPALTRLVRGPDYDTEAHYLKTWLGRPEGVVLDLACGTGRYTRWLANTVGADRVIAIDLSHAMLTQARAESPELCFLRGSAQALPIRRGTLGAVVSFGALHLFPDPVAALEEIGRVLVPGGRFVCLTAFAVEGGVAHTLQRGVGGAIRLRFLHREAIMTGLTRGGMQLVDLTPVGMMALLTGVRGQ